MMAEFNAKNGAALDRLINEQGVELRRFSDDIFDAFGKASAEVYEEAAAHSDLAARINDSFLKARNELGSWTKLADQAYGAQRNRVLGL